MIEPVASVLAMEVPRIDDGEAQSALAPVLWLLEQADNGVKLTQTGALNRALVRDFAERWPGWWEADLFGPPNRETDVNRLWEIHQLLRAARLLRRRKSRLFTTKRGQALQAQPAELLKMLTDELLAGESFESACGELVAALLLSGIKGDFSDAIAERIRPALVSQGWEAGGEPPDVRDVSWAVASFLRPAEAIGLLEAEGSGSGRWRDRLVLREVGRAALLTVLHARVLTPATGS